LKPLGNFLGHSPQWESRTAASGIVTHWSRLMLILTRRVGETLQIGADISVTVVEVNGNQVRIGIAAPKDVAIMRDDAKKRQPAAAPA